MNMSIGTIAIKTVRALDRVTDLAVELLLCAVLVLGLYSLWDSEQLYQTADAANYRPYRPRADDTLSFEQLRSRNPEVIAWLTVDGTSIDYPVTQADNNEKYINTDAQGQYTLSGAVFLDYRNSPGFDDFNSILYGHHMEKKRMFGALSDFADKEYFNAHPSGSVFFDGREHRLDFFALILTDAYDRNLFSPGLSAEDERQEFLEHIHTAALHTRDIPVTTEDRLVMLSTCTTAITNGRYLLIGKLTDQPGENG